MSSITSRESRSQGLIEQRLSTSKIVRTVAKDGAIDALCRFEDGRRLDISSHPELAVCREHDTPRRRQDGAAAAYLMV
jgi:hypothetical protein